MAFAVLSGLTMTMKGPSGLFIVPTLRGANKKSYRIANTGRSETGGAVGTVANLESDLNGISAENFEARCTLRKFQVMTEICRKFSRYARQEFHLMNESSA